MRIGVGVCAAALLSATGVSAGIGTVGAVNTDMHGTPPAASPRALTLGEGVVQDERIVTSATGSGQLVFQDQTTLSVAPESDLVLDTYVYDPNTGTGDMAISLGRGALRFIGGRISKKRDVRIKTPTSTIGIRGGLCIVRVNAAGVTQVIQIAGEYTTVTGITGNTVTLSRPNATAQVGADGAATYTGLADQDTLNDVYQKFEGDGDGGSAEETAPANKAEGTSGSGGTREANRDSGSTGGGDGHAKVAAVNSDVEGGEERAPVSTSGEQDAGPQGTTTTGTGAEVQADTADTVRDPGTTTTPTTVTSPFPTAGAAFSPASGFVAFSSITPGSIIGTAGGTTLTIPNPASPAEFVTSFTAGPVPNYFAQSLRPNAGFFEFAAADGGNMSGLGPITGVGFADLDLGFYAVQFKTTAAVPVDGVAVFGTPTPGQASVFSGSTGTLPAEANTIDLYIVEPELVPDGGADFGPPPGLLVIANANEARIPHPSHGLPANGGRILHAQVEVVLDPILGHQVSDFSVLAGPLTAAAGSGPRFGEQLFETRSTGPTFGIGRTSVGTFEDAGGNTVYGPDGEYLAVTSLHRPGGTGGFVFDPGFEHDLGQPNIARDPVFGVLTLDPAAAGVALNPLALASDTTSRESIGLGGGIFDAALATGFAMCSSGNCGPSVGGGGRAGMYALLPAFGPASGFVEFNFGQINGVDDNEVGAFFDLTDGVGLDAGIQGGPTTGPSPNFVFGANAGSIGTSAYLDDDHFAFAHAGPQIIDGAPLAAEFAVASSGLAGDGGVLPAGVDPTPSFLRWGWWSASFNPVDQTNGNVREDILHLGTWVAGARPAAADMPFTGTAAFTGLAVGTDANLATRETAIVGGDFSLTYDFGAAAGSMNLNIAGFAFSGVALTGNPAATHDYQGSTTGPGGANLFAFGGFYSGGGAVVAATGGHFNIVDPANDRQVVGIFGGDKN